MTKYKIGFIGAGKIASAIIKGLIRTEFLKPENIIASQVEENIEEKSKILGIRVINDNLEVAKDSEIVFIEDHYAS